MLQDLRFALSSLRRRPFVAAAVILTLGLGIGANAAIFRAFSAAFLRPLPFRAEERLVRVFLSKIEGTSGLSPRPDVFLAVREHSRSFSGIAAQRFNDFTLVSNGEPQRISGIEVSERWAETLGVTAQVGRTFLPNEDGVAVISDSMWRSRFAAAPDVLGRPLNLNGQPYTIVGVMAPGLRFPYESEVWIPARFEAQGDATWGLNIVARLRDGVSHAAAASELRALSTRLPEVRAQSGMRLSAVPVRETLVDDEGPVVVAVSATAVFLLLLIAVNVANLLAAQSLSRQREFAIRASLGAGFARLLRQTMTEGLVLATAGGVVGIGVALASTRLLAFLVPENFSYVFDSLPMDARVIGFTAALVMVTGLAFGFIPALRVVRRAPQEMLIGGRGSTDSQPMRRKAAIVNAAQLALAVVLLVAAHALIQDVQRRLSRDIGYDPRGILTASVVLAADRYPGAEERTQFYDRLVDELSALPGVDAAGTVNLFPAAGQGALIARVEGEGVPYDEESPLLVHNRMVHGRIAEAIGLRFVAGRTLSHDELRRGDAVVVISRSLAQTLWPNQDPIGQRIRNRRDADAPWLRVVGVVGDLQEHYADTTRAMWQPVRLTASNASTAQISIVLRSALDPQSLATSLRGTIRKLDPGLAVFEVATAEELHRNSLSGRESARTLAGAFAALGLLVAAIGVYASMAFAMSRRTRELAVRMALGATPSILRREFLGSAARVAAAGVAGGVVATMALMRIGRTITADFSVTMTSYVVAAVLLSIVALVASWLPLRRAMRLEPSAILQSE